MDYSYTNLNQVRAICGIASDIIPDNDGIIILNGTNAEVDKFFNTSFVPKDIFEKKQGTGTERITVERNPLLNVLSVRIRTTDITPKYVNFDDTGLIILTNTAEKRVWSTINPYENMIKYRYGMLNNSSIYSATLNSEVSGSSVTVEVADGTYFEDGDWVKIEGMDGNIETTQIISGGTTNKLVMNLTYDHETGSIITVLEIPSAVKRFAQVLCALAFVLRVVGQSYTDIVGYGVGDFNVQKGEPYTQWRETANQLIREKDELIKRIGIRPSFV